jgi:ATP/maltotriose-dependent transcriptional regulator MalT
MATTAAMLAQIICEQGRLDDAWAFTEVAEEAAASDDLSAQILWRGVRARLLARRGDMSEAKRLSSEAVRLAARTDWLTDHADALLSRADVLRMAGESEATANAVHAAAALYERKGNTVGARRARSMLAAGGRGSGHHASR